MNALHSAIELDAQHAPEIFIFRFSRWPSLVEQKTLLKSLVEDKHLTDNSSALINTTSLTELPDPEDHGR